MEREPYEKVVTSGQLLDLLLKGLVDCIRENFAMDVFCRPHGIHVRSLIIFLLGGLPIYAQSDLASSLEDEAPADSVHQVRFLTSKECSLCHSFSAGAKAMRDRKERNVAPYDLWSGSMMANSARDPYWRAALSAEVAATPNQKQHIEEVCSRCHAPMAAPVTKSPEGQVLAFLGESNPKHPLGNDGVSCTVCHQISPENLGTAKSYTGGFVFNPRQAIYGPHANPVTMPMQRHVGYTPTQGDHILRSAMCATCHTVITGSFDQHGDETHMRLHEQVPYFEWRNSIYNDEMADNRATAKSCQDCHVPQTDVDGEAISARLAHNPAGRDFPFLNPRQPIGRHTFLGGNVFMTQLIRDHRQALGIATPATAFDRVIEDSRKMLQTTTATLQIGDLKSDGRTTVIPITLQNLSGHKFPTAYPSRRAWIELVVKDERGQVVFASGQVNARGQITDAEGVPLPSELAGGLVQSHADVIRGSEQTQIYETFMQDSQNDLTFALLRGSQFKKDNRILPRGWSSDHEHAEQTRPAGIGEDPNFLAGTDTTRYEMPLAKGKYRVEARLLFQSLSSRYMAELWTHDTPEVKAFAKMYSTSKLAPEVIAKVAADVQVE